MTIDIPSVLEHLKHVDLTSAAIGATVARSLEAAAVQAVRRLPALAIGFLKARVQKQIAAGKIDAPTVKLLKAYAAATFDWVDEELPDAPGDAKMLAAIDRLAAVPYLGLIVRADRAGVQQVLQAAYDAINAEAKAAAATLGGAARAEATPTPSPAAGAAATPPPATTA